MKRYLYLLCVLAVAVSAMASAASGASASQQVLCKTESKICSSGNILPAGSWITFVGPMTLSNSTMTFSCNWARLGTQTTEERGNASYFGIPALHGYTSLSIDGCTITKPAFATCTTYLTGGKVDSYQFWGNQNSIGTFEHRLEITFSCAATNGPRECTFKMQGSQGQGEFSVSYQNLGEGYFAKSGTPQMSLAKGNSALCGTEATFSYPHGELLTQSYLSEA